MTRKCRPAPPLSPIPDASRPLADYLRRARKRMGQPDHSDHPERSSSSLPTLRPRAAFVGLLLTLALVLGCFFGTALLGIRGSAARLFTERGSVLAPPEPPGPRQPGQAQRRLEEVKKQRIPFINVAARNLAGTSTDLGGGVTLRYLAPRLPYLTGTNSDANNNSVVFKVSMGRVGFLFTGDMEEDERARLLANTSVEDLRATVLKVAHHGSHNGTDAAFLSRVRPEAAVISCEVGNR